MSELSAGRVDVSSKGARRAADIVQAGAELLLSEGFTAVNKRRIAARLGISDGNVSYYFHSREALWDAVVDHELAAYYRRHHGWLHEGGSSAGGDPQTRFDEFVRRWIDEYQDRLVRVFFSQVLTKAEVDPAMARRRDGIYEAFLQQTKTMARPLVPEVEEVELERRALIVMALLEGLHAVSAFRPDAVARGAMLPERVVEQVNAVVRGGSGAP